MPHLELIRSVGPKIAPFFEAWFPPEYDPDEHEHWIDYLLKHPVSVPFAILTGLAFAAAITLAGWMLLVVIFAAFDPGGA